MASNTKQTVEIAFKVVGIDINKIDAFADGFKKLDKFVKSATTSVNKFQKSLSKIKTPPTFARLTTSLQKLEKIKLTNIDVIVKSLSAISKIKSNPALTEIAKSLTQLTAVKVPNILGLAKGLQLLVTTKFSGFGMKITSITTALKQFKNISVPNILNLAKGLKLLLATPFSGFGLKITTITTALERLKGISLPNVKQISSGLAELVKLDIAKVSQKIHELNTALAQLSKRGAIKSFQSFAKDLRVVQGALAGAGAASKNASSAFKAVGNAAESSGLKLRTFGDKVRTVMEFRFISEVLLQLKASIVSGTQAIISYDQALKDLQAITGATDTEVAKLGETILDVASKTKFSASEVAEGMRVIGQSGFSASESIQTMQSVSDLATGTLSGMATTVDLVTTAMRVFDIDASRSTEVVDVFANAVNKSKLTIDKLRTAMNFVGPIAKESGVSFQELSAAMGTLANSGIRASTIGTGLRRVFAELVDPSKKLKAAADAVGISLRDLSPESTDLSSVLQNLRLVIKDTGTAFDIFGKRGAAAVLALTSSSSKFNTMLDLVSRSGTAAEQAAKQMEGLGISFKNLKDKLGVLAIALGSGGLAEALKVIADVSRYVVDTLIVFAGSPLGNLIIKLGVLTAAVAAAVAAFTALQFVMGTAAFATFTAVFTAVTATLWSGVVAVQAFVAALGPVGWIVAALGVAFIALNTSVSQTTGELLNSAAEFGNLSKQLKDYRVAIVGLDKDSKELEIKTRALRDQLLKTANGYGEAADEAAKAAASISPLTGKIIKNNKAIEKYAEVLNTLEFSKLSKAADVANKVFHDSTSKYASDIRVLKETFQGLVILFDRGFGKSNTFFKQTSDARKLVEQLRNNEAGFRELKEHVLSLDRTSKNLSDTNKVLIAQYDILIEAAGKSFENLKKMGKVDVMSTVDGFEQLAKKLKYSGEHLEALVVHFERFKELNEGEITNIIEKWSKDLDTDNIVEFIDKNKELIGVFKEGQEEEIRASAIKKKELMKNLIIAKKVYAEEMKFATGKEKLVATKKFLTTEGRLIKQAAELQAKSSRNSAEQRINALMAELEKRKILMAQANENLVGQDLALERRRQQIIRESERRIEDIRAGAITDDPTVDLEAYESDLKQKEQILANYISRINLLEAEGAISSEEAAAQKLATTISFYELSYKKAVEVRNKINELESPEEYKKANEAVLKAQQTLYDTKLKYAIEYANKAKALQDKILETDKEIFEEQAENTKKLKDLKTDLIEKLLSLDKAYAAKRESIETALTNKLKALDDSIIANRKKTISDLLSLESSSEEKIRNVRKKGMTDIQKNTSDRTAAQKYLAEGNRLIAEAEASKDSEKLARGVTLIKQSESLASGLTSEITSVELLKKALSSLKNARNVEGELAELELIKKKNEEIAEAAAKGIIAKEAYDSKVAAATTANDALIKLEEVRHTSEMEDLDAEIGKYLEKLELAYKIKEIASGGDSKELQNIAEEVDALQNKHSVALDGISKSEKATLDSHKIILKSGADLSENVIKKLSDFSNVRTEAQKAYGDISDKVEVSMDKMFSSVDKNGVTTFTNLGSNIADTFAEVDENGVQTFTNIADTAFTEFGKIDENGVKVFTNIANGAKDKFIESFNGVEEKSATTFEKVATDSETSLDGMLEKIESIGFDDIEISGSSAFESIGESVTKVTEKVDQISFESVNTEITEFKTIFDSIQDRVLALIVEIQGRDTFTEFKDIFASLEDKLLLLSIEIAGMEQFISFKEAYEFIADKTINLIVGIPGLAQFTSFKAAYELMKSKAVTLSIKVTGYTQFKRFIDIYEKLKHKTITLLINISGYAKFMQFVSYYNNLKNKTITNTIITRYVTKGRPAKKKSGGRLPGFGGGDRRPILAEDGEWFIRKEAVRKYGDDFLSRINSMSLPKFADGGVVGGAMGGSISEQVTKAAETLIVRFQAGGLEAPVKITDTNSRIAIKNMANELTKMRLIYAR